MHGCVSTVREALQGCQVTPLGVMRYIAVASPQFIDERLPGGLTAANFSPLPFLVFNRKDDMQAQWVAPAFGLAAPRLRERYVPSSEAYVRTVPCGWGIGVAPEIQVRERVQRGDLRVLHPHVQVPVALHWHRWKLGDKASTGGVRASLLDRVGQSLVEGAARALAAARRRRDVDSDRRDRLPGAAN